jgi:hypothetical protein
MPPAGFSDLVAAWLPRLDATGEAGATSTCGWSRPRTARCTLWTFPGRRTGTRRRASRQPARDPAPSAMGGESTAYERGVGEALRRAGAGPGDPALLVGAVRAGSSPPGANHFVPVDSSGVTHVVTFGAGRAAGRARLGGDAVGGEPHDIVAHLDAADNPTPPNRTTVSSTTTTAGSGTTTRWRCPTRRPRGRWTPAPTRWSRSGTAPQRSWATSMAGGVDLRVPVRRG